MAAELFDPYTRLTNANAAALSGAKLYFYQTGTLVLQSVYTTSALSVAHTNPVVADSGGLFAAIYLDGTKQYRAIFKDADGNTILDVDPCHDRVMYQLAQSTGAALVGITGGQTLQSWINNRLTDVKRYGVVADGVTDDAAAWNTAFAAGVPLWWGGGTSLVGSTINIPDGAALYGAGPEFCRMEKRYFESGTKAMLQPTGLDNSTGDGAGINNVILKGFTAGCQSGVYESAGVVSGKIIATGRNQGWLIEDVAIDHWRGFAITLAGRGHTVRNIKFSNPYSALGVDGCHVAECDDETLPHFIENLSGTTGDDMLGIFPADVGSGPLANANILGVIAHGIRGESLVARIVGCGFAETGLTGRVANIRVTGVQGKGASTSLGPITIRNFATATAILENIYIDAILDGTGSNSYVGITGVASGQPASRMRDITLKIKSLNNTTGPTANGIDVDGLVENLKLDVNIDCSSATGYGFTWTNVRNSKGYDVRGWIKAGADNGFHVPGSASFMNGGNIDLTIENIASSKTGFNVAGLRNTTVRLILSEASGATTTVGVTEGAQCQNNVFANGDFSGVDTAVSLAQTDSIYFNNTGYKTEANGTGTIGNGTTTSGNIAHGLGYTPSRHDVTITWTAANADQAGWAVSTIDATNLVVTVPANVGGARAFSWAVRRMKQ
jgi:hypothetical protein